MIFYWFLLPLNDRYCIVFDWWYRRFSPTDSPQVVVLLLVKKAWVSLFIRMVHRSVYKIHKRLSGCIYFDVCRSKTEPTTCQRILLWTVIMALSLAFFIAGLILILRSIEDDREETIGRLDHMVLTKETLLTCKILSSFSNYFHHKWKACNLKFSEWNMNLLLKN